MNAALSWASGDIGRMVAIVHHVPGRVRLKLADGPLPDGFGAGDLAALGRWGGPASPVRSVRINYLARSCVVEYDPAVVPPAAWEDLLAGRETAASAGLLRLLAAVFARSAT